MPTATGERHDLSPRAPYRAATDPIEPLHEYTIPIPPFKRPPAKDDFPETRRRRKPRDSGQEAPHPPGNRDGHIDEYA